jgi:hypothetical protein
MKTQVQSLVKDWINAWWRDRIPGKNILDSGQVYFFSGFPFSRE